MGKTFKSIEVIRPFVRNGAFPIDTTTLFYSYDDAVTYAHTDVNAYAGQIISIDDDNLKKVGVYIVDYDKTGTFRFVISPIETSNSNGSVLFNWKGTVNTTNDLPNFSYQGDVYLVKSDHKFYVAYEQADDSVAWSEMTLGIEYASISTDGIITKEVYSAMSNQTSKDAIWFSSSDNNIKNNKWVEVSHTVTETATNMKIPSVGQVKTIVSDMIKAELPHVELESITSTKNYVGSTVTPKFKIHYYPEFGGNPTAINIYQIINGVRTTAPIYTNTNLTLPEYDTANARYTFTYTGQNNISSSVEYDVIINYAGSADGNVLNSLTSASISYNFYNAILYGTNKESFTDYYLNTKQIINLNYNPTKFTDKTTSIYFKIPAIGALTSVTYVNQNDDYAKELFTATTEMIGSTNYKIYTYSLSEILPFKSPGCFTFYIN